MVLSKKEKEDKKRIANIKKFNKKNKNKQQYYNDITNKIITINKIKTKDLKNKVKFEGKYKKYNDAGDLSIKLNISYSDTIKYLENTIDKEHFIYSLTDKKGKKSVKKFDIKNSKNLALFFKTLNIDNRKDQLKIKKQMLSDNKFEFKDIKFSNKPIEGVGLYKNIKYIANFGSGEPRELTEQIPAEINTSYTKDFASSDLTGFSIITYTESEEIITDLIKENNGFYKEVSFQFIENTAPSETMELFKNSKDVLTNIKLYNTNYLKINSLFGNNLLNLKLKDCIQDFLPILWKNIEPENYKNIRTSEDMYNFCNNNGIGLLIIDINKNILYELSSKSKHKNLIGVNYDEHFYPLRNKNLKNPNKSDIILEIVEDVKYRLIKAIQDGFYPTDILFETKTKNIKSFKYDNYQISNNKEYYKCVDIINKFEIFRKLNIEKRVKLTTNMTNICDIIEPLYTNKISDLDSFIPMGNHFTKGGYNYGQPCRNQESTVLICNKTPELNIYRYTIDNVKSYPSALYNLSYLTKTDIRDHETKKINLKSTDANIMENWLYIAVPNKEYSCQLLENVNLYSGEHLIYCRNLGLPFTILEELQTTKINNHYTEMFDDMRKFMSESEFKIACNRFIGMFERQKDISHYIEGEKICRDKEMNTHNGYKIEKIYKDYSICLKNKQIFGVYNRKPIAVQLKDKQRRTLYEKMNSILKDFDLNKDCIESIKTDSFTIASPKPLDLTKHIDNKFGGWRLETPKPPPSATQIIYDDPILKTFDYKNIEHHYINNNNKFNDYWYENNNEIVIGYAGSGKTFDIINNRIPEIQKQNKLFMIYVPTHAAEIPYRKIPFLKDKVDVIQFKEVPLNINTIIIDEIGMVDKDGWDFIYKCFLAHKTILAFGDFKQLPPISGTIFNNENWLNYIFGKITYNTDNYRNTKSIEYYDELINIDTDLNIINGYSEVINHSTNNFYEAEYILCYYNSTRILYNNKMCEKLGIKSKLDFGAKLIVRNNKLKELDIYNNTEYIVLLEGDNANEIQIKDCFGDIKTIDKKYIKSNTFDYGYARTVNSIQGSTINSYYFAEEDININVFKKQGLAYTIVSRLREDKPIIC